MIYNNRACLLAECNANKICDLEGEGGGGARKGYKNLLWLIASFVRLNFNHKLL